jgi:hypothetical protein
MRRRSFVAVGFCAAACGSRTGILSDLDAADADRPVPVVVDAAADPCADAGVPPSILECTGLYADFASKTLAPGVRAYAPAVSLWSDGAAKERWIELPPGQTIDASDPDEWVFPVGTKLFKQFSYGGKRVETRMFLKASPGYWVHATYAWNASDSATRISYGETVPAGDGGAWVIPTPQECDACHHGRSDRVLGFEAVGLGLDGATGLTLRQLVAEGLITPAPARVTLSIGGDRAGLGSAALAWLHVNCGVTCHNANEGAQAYGAGMRLRLDPAWLDGSPPSAMWDPIATTVGVPCTSGSVAGQPRIAPGDPSSSVVVQLIDQRGELQMPPAPLSRFVDDAAVASVSAWIHHM